MFQLLETVLFISTALLLMRDAEPCSVPVIRKSFKTILDVPQGHKIRLPCLVRDPGKDKTLSYRWDKNNETLYPGSHPRIKVKIYRYLKIKGTRKEDTAKYTCVVTNKCGTSKFTLDLYINGPTKHQENKSAIAPPRFTTRKDILGRNLIAISVGNSVTLDCSAKGYPHPTVKWYKDGVLFPERKNRRLYLGTKTTVLSMKDVVPSDSGIYMCNVSNPYGWINHSYKVDVHERVRAKPVVPPCC